jgi:hypothetical protein
MKHLSQAALFAAAGILLTLTPVDAESQATYSLKAVEANPIPKDEHFRLWKEVALKACSESKTRFNLGESECLAVIAQRADVCASQLTNQSPALISTTAVARDVGRKYLHCATPFYFCKGVEVKTEAEVRAKCQ